MKFNIRDYLKEHGGDEIELPAIVEFDDLFQFAGVDDDIELDIHELLARDEKIAAIWSTEDVQIVRPDLTEDEAWEVLKEVRRTYDAQIGINGLTLESVATTLFGPGPEHAKAKATMTQSGNRRSRNAFGPGRVHSTTSQRKDKPMKKYHVKVAVQTLEIYEVEAASQDEASELWAEGKLISTSDDTLDTAVLSVREA